MGNLTIEKINEINISTGFIRNYPVVTGGDLLSKISGQEGRIRVFNMETNIPPDGISGDNDYFCDVDISQQDAWIRIDAKNVRTGDWWYIQKKAGVWKTWTKVISQTQMDTALDLKVSKDGTKILSDENYTTAEKQKLANVTTHFKGLFNLSSELPTSGCVNGDYAFVKGDPNASIWYWKDGSWHDSESTLGGSMMKEIYDPSNIAKDMYNRVNHTGTQSISTISQLQEELNNKLNITDKTNIIDNFNSTSPTSGLSANCGNILNHSITSILSDAETIDYGSYFGETGGYAKLTSGLIIQFGQVKTSSNTAKQDFVFPVPFPNKCYVVLATCEGDTSSGSGVDGVYANIIDNTKASIIHDYKNVSVGTLNHYVIAIGN